MEEAFVSLYRQAEMIRHSSEPPVNIYFECARDHLRGIVEASLGVSVLGPNMVDPAALWGFPVCINDQLKKPRLVIEPFHVGENS